MTLEEHEEKWKQWPQGDAGDVIDFACDHISDRFEAIGFIDGWRHGDVAEWPEYADWLKVQRDGTRASVRARSTKSGGEG